jgi:GDP-L-fucose synthase
VKTRSSTFSLHGKKIYLAGHTGLVGSALQRHFSKIKGVKLITIPHAKLDLTDGAAVRKALARHRPDVVIVAAGRVGGIVANSKYPAEFIYQNLMIVTNVIDASWRAGVKRLLNFGSACIYPRECDQPMSIDKLMTGKLESTSEPYAMAKLAGLSLCESYSRQYGVSYFSVIPSNLYGPNENFDPTQAHVLAALIRRFHFAKVNGDSEIALWGTGKPIREFLYVDDLGSACELLLKKYDDSAPINIGSGQFYSIAELAKVISKVVGFKGKIVWDKSKPDGAHAKRLDWGPIKKMGWKPKMKLSEGIARTYSWFLKNVVASKS